MMNNVFSFYYCLNFGFVCTFKLSLLNTKQNAPKLEIKNAPVPQQNDKLGFFMFIFSSFWNHHHRCFSAFANSTVCDDRLARVERLSKILQMKIGFS